MSRDHHCYSNIQVQDELFELTRELMFLAWSGTRSALNGFRSQIDIDGAVPTIKIENKPSQKEG